MRVFLAVAGVMAASFVVAGCDRTPQAADRASSAIPVQVAAAASRQLRATEEFSGRIEATETVDVRARVSGSIDAVHFVDGQEVAKGALLFTIDQRPFRAEVARAEAQLAAARSQLRLAQGELERVKPLVAVNAASLQELDQLSAGAQSAAASVQSAEAALDTARLNLAFTEVRAPIAGRASRTSATRGNLVAAGETALTSIVAVERVHVYFDVSEQAFLANLAAQRGVRAAPPAVAVALANETGFPHKGVVDFVDNRLNASTGAIRVRALLDNSQRRFTPGLFARVRVEAADAAPAVVIPDVAIGTQQTKRFVFVVDGNNTVQWREVVLGRALDGERVVLSGLQPAERVLVSGLQQVRPGATVAPQEAKLAKAEAR